VAVFVTALLSAACAAPTDHSAGFPTDTLPDAVVSGPVDVVADPVLRNAFTQNKARLAVDNRGLRVGMTFTEPHSVAHRDVVAGVASAIGALATSGVVESPTLFARDELEAVIAPGNPRRLAAASDLARPGLRIAVLTSSGDAARAALGKLGVVTVPTVMSDVAGAVAIINAGGADVLIAYTSDVASVPGADLFVSIPAAQNVPRVFAAAVVKKAAHKAAAESFVEQLTSGVGSQAVQAAGFLLP
jgi:molybdate transport system substrate-binding protein